MVPRKACWARKYFCECLTTIITSTIDTGRMTIVTPVMMVLMDSIMMMTPMMVVTEVMSWVTDWLRL